MTIQTVMGFLLGVIGLGILTVAWWQEARRNDKTDAEIAAILDHLGIEIVDVVPEPVPQPTPGDLPTDPGFERPRPSPGPRTEPTEVAAVVAVTADDWLEAWRRETDAEIAAMKASWES